MDITKTNTKRYRIAVTRTYSLTHEIEVEAESLEDAKREAVETADERGDIDTRTRMVRDWHVSAVRRLAFRWLQKVG